MNDAFPRPFVPSSIFDSDFSVERPFLVAAMCTAGYADRARRLAASCRAVGVPFVIYQVPQVHRSISPSGGADDAYTPRAISSASCLTNIAGRSFTSTRTACSRRTRR